MGELGAPGARYFCGNELEVYTKILEEMVRKYDVDREEILVGFGDVPPSDPTCLVYINLTNCAMVEYFRKNLKSDGRWGCGNYVRDEITKEPSLKGTYDLRNGIHYRSW